MSEPADRPDIETYDDCVRLVTAFYGRAMTDPFIGFIFVDVAHLDLDEHIPVIASFWETILLGAGTYSGGAYAVHAALNRKVTLRTGHFERWLGLWNETVDELFAGAPGRQFLAQQRAHGVRVGDAEARGGRAEADAHGDRIGRCGDEHVLADVGVEDAVHRAVVQDQLAVA